MFSSATTSRSMYRTSTWWTDSAILSDFNDDISTALFSSILHELRIFDSSGRDVNIEHRLLETGRRVAFYVVFWERTYT